MTVADAIRKSFDGRRVIVGGNRGVLVDSIAGLGDVCVRLDNLRKVWYDAAYVRLLDDEPLPLPG